MPDAMDLETQITELEAYIEHLKYEANLLKDLYQIVEGHPYCPPHQKPVLFDAVSFVEDIMGS